MDPIAPETADRLRKRAAMCKDFSRESEGTGLARELHELAEEYDADATRLNAYFSALPAES